MNAHAAARIDAQDSSFILPIREFFERANYNVIINQHREVPVDYQVVCGDTEFVKEFFLIKPQKDVRRLILLTDETKEDIRDFSVAAKIVFVDPAPLNDVTVQAIFKFFFTSSEQALDLRKNPKKRVSILKQEKVKNIAHVREPANEQRSEDTERISKIIHSVFSSQEEKKHRGMPHSLWKRSLLLIAILISPFLWYVLSMFLGLTNLGFSLVSLRAGRVSTAAKTASSARFWMRKSEGALAVFAKPFQLTGQTGFIEGQEHLVSLLGEVANATAGVSDVTLRSQRIGARLLSQANRSGAGNSQATEVDDLRTELFSVENSLGIAQSELHEMVRSHAFPFWLGAVTDFGERGERAFARYRETISYIDKFLTLYPRIGGFRESRVYLVLLQNSMELRPTGGFIGSVARLTVENGVVSELDVEDVYALDGALKGHVDPPLSIRELLGQEHWYLRDSNWEPDFEESASRAAWFYEKETGVHVDGVIAVSSPMIVDLLQATGPITLTDYNERITSQNFYGKSLFYTQTDFFPGSTQKKDFLGSLTRALIEKITAGKEANSIALFRAVTTGLVSHDLMFWFADSEVDSLAVQLGWSQRIFNSSPCVGVVGPCYSLPLALFEANVGVNKANYFINRTMTRSIRIETSGMVSETVTVSLQNSSHGQPEDTGGVYRTYLRFFLPASAHVSDVTVDGVTVPQRDRKQKRLQGLPYTEFSSTATHGVVGVALEVPTGGGRQISVSVSHGTVFEMGSEGTLEIFTQKQPGVESTPLTETVSYPVFWFAQPHGEEGEQLSPTKKFLAKDGSLSYNSTLSTDQRTRLLFRK